MPSPSLLIVRGERVLMPGGTTSATIRIEDGRVAAIGSYSERTGSSPVIEAGAMVVMPGIVDTHVHLNDPGRAHWEGFEHGTRAAAAGGVTTVIDMPLNSVPATTSVAALETKRRVAANRCYVDVGFWGGVVPGNASSLGPLAEHGVLGFKCFLAPSGVEEFGHVAEADLREALPVLAKLGLPLLAHAELPSSLADPDRHGDPRRYSTWLASRPPAAEHAAIDLLIRLAHETGARIHIVHLASADALPIFRGARENGVRVTVETCPHYLAFAAEDIPDGATSFKCAPPIRGRDHRERLWQALGAGEIDLIATDHSPAPPAMKEVAAGDFVRAWGGIASLQLGLRAVWTGAAARGISLESVSRLMSAAPANLAGLSSSKGRLAPGLDADLVIFDPDAAGEVDGTSLQHRHPVTPYEGMRLRGAIRTTVLRGEVVFDAGAVTGPARGRLIPAGDARIRPS